MGSYRRFRAVQLFQRFFVDPPVRMVWRLGFSPPGDAELETVGRRTGQPHRTRICNGQVGDTFWLIAQDGGRSDYVANLRADPRVRVRTGSHEPWQSGTAHVLDDDDPRERRRMLSQVSTWHRMCQSATHALSTDPLTIRIDLDPAETATDAEAEAAQCLLRPGPQHSGEVPS